MLPALFTLPDYDLSQESSVDPMGISAIWTSYGQSIFKDRLTTIANDARVFTINVFHHAVLRSLFDNYSEDVEQALKQFSDWRSEFEMKSGLLIFMEDVSTLAYSDDFTTAEEVERLGVLGLSKWRSVKNNGDPQGYMLRASRNHGILKRQIVMGMSGRYKNPLIEMGFFDRFYRYDRPQSVELWAQCENWLSAWTAVAELRSSLLDYLSSDLLKRRTKGHPSVALNSAASDPAFLQLMQGYRKAFGKRSLHSLAQQFWLDQLGIRRGAGMAVYDALRICAPESGPVPYEKVFRQAVTQLTDEPEEQTKVQSILEVAPFLSHSEFILRFLAQRGIKKVPDYEQELSEFRKLWRSSIHFSPNPAIPRLQQLAALAMADGSTRDWITGLFNYHGTIMQARGGSAWVQLNTDDTLHHFYAPSLPGSYNTIGQYMEFQPWLHSYYLDSLKFIQQSL
jgi:hypothetical protein